jgi:tetratricopeptide (TPR) repeat protein
LNDLARSFEKNQEYQKAIQVYEEIFEIEFKKFAVYYSNQAILSIARIYEESLKDKNKALEYYMKIINDKSKYKNPNQIKYAEDKIKKLKEELFFEGKYPPYLHD